MNLYDPNRLGSNLGLDPESYQKAKPYFIAGVRAFGKAGQDIKDMVRALVAWLRGQGMPDTAIRAMQPDLVRFIKDVSSGRLDPFADPKAPPRAPRENKEVASEYQVAYEPRSRARFAVGTLVPNGMAEAVSRALDRVEARHGAIDEYVAKELGYTLDELIGTDEKDGYFSAEQIDALALAIDNVARGKGFIIGDQTGVGKGRFVAAMLRYAARQGKIPVFVTQKPGLYADMVRDLRDIGMPDVQKEIIATNTGMEPVPITGDDDMFIGPKKSEADALVAALNQGKMPRQ